METTTGKPRVFSGIQPTGVLHLGNYIGALRQWVAGQDKRENVFCVVDLHALTIPEAVDPEVLGERVRSTAAQFLAAGVDPERSIVFVQSHVREHSELSWLLSCVTPLGWLYRMTQFKSKSEGRESVGSGLLVYPVLQAADILLYDTDIVPVGEDQVQHVEITRDIAERFNHLFGETFVAPRAELPKAGARLMGLDDPEVKMSKSLEADRPGHLINLLDDEATVTKKLMAAVTDSDRELRYEHASPGVRNLMTIAHVASGRSVEDIEVELEGGGYGTLKRLTAEAVNEMLRPFQKRYREYMDDRQALETILQRGADRAREIASHTLERAQKAMGVG